jgi:CRP-like cAMP-binding protein
MQVQKGGVKLSVVSASGKQAVVAMFGHGYFFGEGCMAGQTLRMGAAAAVTHSTLPVVQQEELLRVLQAQPELSDHFIACMLAHNIPVEEDLIDQLFNSSEKRLARTLLLSARYGEADRAPEPPGQSFAGNPGEHGRNYAITNSGNSPLSNTTEE